MNPITQEHKLDEKNSYIKEDLNIKAWFLYTNHYDVEYYKKFIIPAKAKREWMDQEHTKYAYNCIPLVSANSLGWWILNSQDIKVKWNGGNNLADVEIEDNTSTRNYKLVASHFGSGILTFSIPIVFETPPGWGLIVNGPSNYYIDGLYPLEGIVETNWSPFTFTMNYKITRPNHEIHIPFKMPICRIIPIPLNLNEKTRIILKPIDKNKELDTRQREWHDERRKHLDEEKPGRMFHYRDGIDVRGCPFKGFHKMFYKYKEIE